MRGIMGDINIQGQVAYLLTLLESSAWLGLWNPLNLQLFTFADFALNTNAPDNLVWEVCQREQVVLITANRNQDGPDSLETTLQGDRQEVNYPVGQASRLSGQARRLSHRVCLNLPLAQMRNTETSLPVLTLGDAQQVLHSKAYADRVIERLLEYLIDIDNMRGTGRLYLP